MSRDLEFVWPSAREKKTRIRGGNKANAGTGVLPYPVDVYCSRVRRSEVMGIENAPQRAAHCRREQSANEYRIVREDGVTVKGRGGVWEVRWRRQRGSSRCSRCSEERNSVADEGIRGCTMRQIGFLLVWVGPGAQ